MTTETKLRFDKKKKKKKKRIRDAKVCLSDDFQNLMEMSRS